MIDELWLITHTKDKKIPSIRSRSPSLFSSAFHSFGEINASILKILRRHFRKFRMHLFSLRSTRWYTLTVSLLIQRFFFRYSSSHVIVISCREEYLTLLQFSPLDIVTERRQYSCQFTFIFLVLFYYISIILSTLINRSLFRK